MVTTKPNEFQIWVDGRKPILAQMHKREFIQMMHSSGYDLKLYPRRVWCNGRWHVKCDTRDRDMLRNFIITSETRGRVPFYRCNCDGK